MTKKIGFEDTKRQENFFLFSLKAIRLSLTDALVRIFDVSGRTSRAPYWIATILYGLGAVFSLALATWSLSWSLGLDKNSVQNIFYILTGFFVFILLTLFVRRNHDLGDSVWSVFNPFKGHGLLGKTMFDAGEPNENRFGFPHKLW
jgi:hypothetical protein